MILWDSETEVTQARQATAEEESIDNAASDKIIGTKLMCRQTLHSSCKAYAVKCQVTPRYLLRILA